ncbi:MAG: AMP-binding protein, partial [Phaeodactylibacter sp.]|nr:AMP-binding protein [Phaeodactylibacter sp.]
TEELEAFGRAEDATFFMTLLSVFYLLLHRYSNQEDILIGTPVANRNLPELEPLIGVFINTLVLRMNLSGTPSFRSLVKSVRRVALDAFAHQDLPFEKLVEALNPERDLSRTPLFQVVFNVQNAPMPALNLPDLDMRFLDIDRGQSQFDLSLMLTRAGESWGATVEYNSHLINAETIEGLFQSFQLLLKETMAKPDIPISELQIVPEATLTPLLETFNQTQFDYPRDQCMHVCFEAQAEQTPDAPAIVFQDSSYTYRELNERANRLARRLRKLGVGPDSCVGIFMQKSADIVTVMLAVLKAGGAYLPLHPAYPAERIDFMLKDAAVQVLLTNLEAGNLSAPVQVLRVDAAAAFEAEDSSNLSIPIRPNDLAYIIYTSGSTGKPKGVMVPHRALVNFLSTMQVRPGIQPEDVLLAVTPISFDIAALELFLPLMVGATVLVASEAMITDPYQISAAIQEQRPTIMQATPAFWQLLIESGWAGAPGLKVLCGGYVLTPTLAEQLLDRVDSLWNMYGPTETTIWSSVCRIQKGAGAISIGTPIGNTQLYILDRHLQSLPIGVVGELHIGGEGL